METFQNIKQGKVPKFDQSFDPDAKDLIIQLLKKDPEQRIGAGKFSDLKKHPFFDGINFDTIRSEPVPVNLILSNSSKTRKQRATLKLNDQGLEMRNSGARSANNSPMAKGSPLQKKTRQTLGDTLKSSFVTASEVQDFNEESNDALKMTEIHDDAPVIVLSGMLRKKGLVFFNERTCVLNSEGIFSYTNLRKGENKNNRINVRSKNVQIHFEYSK